MLRCLNAKVRATEKIPGTFSGGVILSVKAYNMMKAKHTRKISTKAPMRFIERFEYYCFAAELFSLCLYVCVNVYMNLCVCMLDDFLMNVYTYNFNAIYLCMYVPRFLIAYKYG